MKDVSKMLSELIKRREWEETCVMCNAKIKASNQCDGFVFHIFGGAICYDCKINRTQEVYETHLKNLKNGYPSPQLP